MAAAAATPALNLALAGSARGVSLGGKVQFGRVMCVPLSNHGLEVQWSGSVQVKKRVFKNVNGGMSFQKTGKSTFGPKGTAIASLVVNGDYSDRFGSGLPGGSGTAVVAKSRKSGSIDAVVVSGRYKVRIKGSWACG